MVVVDVVVKEVVEVVVFRLQSAPRPDSIDNINVGPKVCTRCQIEKDI